MPNTWLAIPPPPLPLQGVRSLCRFFLLFFMPVFFGPYWSWVHVQTNFAFAFFFSILVCAMLSWRMGGVIWECGTCAEGD